MDTELLKKAQAEIKSTQVLVNLVSKRLKQLINGEKPLVSPKSCDEEKVDIVLREIVEKKLIAEIDFDAIARAEDAKTRWAKRAEMKNIFAD